MTMLNMACAQEDRLISHNLHQDILDEIDFSEYKRRLESKQNLTLPLEEELDLLQQLSEFELGRFLLRNKGLNGYWTAYIILYAFEQKNLHPLEEWLVHSAPIIQATRERFEIFKRIIQENIRDNMVIASVPCGLMDDVFSCNYNHANNIRLVGIDLDPNSIELAKENATLYGVQNVEYKEEGAWSLMAEGSYDLLVSNGLNIYEPSSQRRIDLYLSFYNALKPEGLLIISFLTPPTGDLNQSALKNHQQKDALKQKAILSDIIEAKWQVFLTQEEIIAELSQANFSIISVTADTQGSFPTILARKVIP